MLEHNRFLFEGKTLSAWAVIHRTLGALGILPNVSKLQSLRLSLINRISGFGVAFFDGVYAAGGTICGASGAIK